MKPPTRLFNNPPIGVETGHSALLFWLLVGQLHYGVQVDVQQLGIPIVHRR